MSSTTKYNSFAGVAVLSILALFSSYSLAFASGVPADANINISSNSVAKNVKFSMNWSADNSPVFYKVKVDSNEYNMGAAESWEGTPSDLSLNVGSHTISLQACNNSGCGEWSKVKTLTVGEAVDLTKVTSTTPSTSGLTSLNTTATVCVDLTENLVRGTESSSVLKLQEFLIAKGLLNYQATGFFGDLTLGAVKSYQASVGLPQTGMVYEMTRASIKKETCSI